MSWEPEELDEEQRRFQRMVTPRRPWLDDILGFLGWVFWVALIVAAFVFQIYREWWIWTR